MLHLAWGYEHGGLVGFPGSASGSTTILARVGVSLISIDQACSTAEEEIPDWDFERVLGDSQEQWRDILGRVQVQTDGVDVNTTTLLYSSVRLKVPICSETVKSVSSVIPYPSSSR